MDDFNANISELIHYLKARKMCRSSIRSHRECYEVLARYLDDHAIYYSRNVGNSWLKSIQSEIDFNKFDIWVWYIRQLNEFLERGSISDSIYYLTHLFRKLGW